MVSLTTFFIFMFFSVHILACGWVYLGKYNGDDGWIKAHGEKLDDHDFFYYIAACYWIITTFSTVGYGDFSANATSEYIYSYCLKIIGIGFFAWMLA